MTTNSMRTRSLLLTLTGLLLTTACASVTPHPLRNEFPAGLQQTARVRIADVDSSRKEICRFGLLGLLFPVVVEFGHGLEAFAEHYLGHAFTRVEFGEGSEAVDLDVHLRVDEFSISAFNKAAHLELTIVIVDDGGNTLLSKTYSEVGEGHMPLYLSAFDQEAQVRATSAQALTAVFDRIQEDLVGLGLPNP